MIPTGKKPKKAAAKPAPKVKAASKKPAAKPAKLIAGMRPNQLGSMNGPLHANINAVLAHIRNGNTNGPIGAYAALASADYSFAATGTSLTAQEVISLDIQFEALNSALSLYGYTSVTDYYDALNPETIEEIEILLDEDGNVIPGNEALLDAAILASPYETLDAYQTATTPAPQIEAIDSAIEVLGGDADTLTDVTAVAPTEEQVLAAEGVVEAESGMLNTWNKLDEATDEQKAALLEQLRLQLEDDTDAIASAVEEAAAAQAAALAEEGAEGIEGAVVEGEGADPV